MSLVGGIISKVAGLVPVVGGILSAGVSIADKVIDQSRAAKEQTDVAQEASSRAAMASRQVPSLPDVNSLMFGNKSSGTTDTTESVLGKSTYLSEKFGIGKGLFGQANI